MIPSRLAHLASMNETAQIAHTFLTQHELAELLQLPERTLEGWRLTHAGPPYMKLGRHVRYDMWIQETGRLPGEAPGSHGISYPSASATRDGRTKRCSTNTTIASRATTAP